MNINWDQLRDRFFNECVDRVNGSCVHALTPHNTFEWFKKQIMPDVSSSSTVDLRVTQIPSYEKMSEQQLIDIGFVLVHQFPHDEFHTKRFKKGLMIVEITYDANTLLTSELTFDNIYYHPITFEEITQLDPVLGKSVLPLRVRFFPIDTSETFAGTVIDEKPNFYVVIPDHNLELTQNWTKKRCVLLPLNK